MTLTSTITLEYERNGIFLLITKNCKLQKLTQGNLSRKGIYRKDFSAELTGGLEKPGKGAGTTRDKRQSSGPQLV